MTGQRVVGYGGMWARPKDGPRIMENPVGELPTIRQYLNHYRLTLGMKCEDLSVGQLATRSVPPSTMSLLGLVRHLAHVEHHWFQRVLRNDRDAPRLYWSADNHDLDFDGAVADPAVVEDTFTTWRAQITAADHWLDELTDLDAVAHTPRANRSPCGTSSSTWSRSTPATADTPTCCASASTAVPGSDGSTRERRRPPDPPEQRRRKRIGIHRIHVGLR